MKSSLSGQNTPPQPQKTPQTVCFCKTTILRLFIPSSFLATPGASHLVAVHRHSLRVSAQLSLSSRADWSAPSMSSSSTALLQSQELLGTESLVVDLRCGLDKVLQMGASEKVSQVHKFAMVLIFNVDNTPSVLAASNLLASN